MSTTARLPLPGTAFHSEPFAPSRSFSTSSMKVTTAPATKKRCTPLPATKPFFADDPHLATTLYPHLYPPELLGSRFPGSLRIIDGTQFFSFAGIRGSAPTSRLIALSIRANGTTVFRFQFQCHGAMAAPWIMNYRTAVTRPAKWFRIPITAIVTIRGVCAQGFSGEGHTAFDGYYQHRSMMAELESNVSWQQSRYFSVGGTVRGGFYGDASRRGAT